jgi:hypothetical protein
MSKVSDELTAVAGNLTSIATGVANLDSQIQAFGNPGDSLTPATQAQLDAIQSQSAALAQTANSAAAAPTVPVTPPATTPTTT